MRTQFPKVPASPERGGVRDWRSCLRRHSGHLEPRTVVAFVVAEPVALLEARERAVAGRSRLAEGGGSEEPGELVEAASRDPVVECKRQAEERTAKGSGPPATSAAGRTSSRSRRTRRCR